MPSAEPDRNVVNLEGFRALREQEVWQRYCAARAAAERSGDIGDGIAAGHAWRAWLDLFQSSAQREADREFDRVMQLRRSS